jgi:DNA-binding transcriptional ArsR family regulator
MAKKTSLQETEPGSGIPEDNKVPPGASPTIAELEMTPLENEILDIAHELIEAHYIIVLDNLFTESIRRIKEASRNSLLMAINALVQKKIIFEGKSITRDSIMDNQTRKAIFQLVIAEPGIHFSRIKEIMQKDSRTISLHLGILLRFSLIRSKEFDSNIVYFDKNLGEEFDYIYYFIHKKHVRDVFKVLIKNPGISFEDLCNAIVPDTTRGNFLRKINVLVEAGFLTAMRDGNQIVALQVHTRFIPPITFFIENVDSR